MAEVSAFSLAWHSEPKSLKEISTSGANVSRNGHQSSGAALLVKVQCMRDPCQCALNNQEILMVKPFRNVSVVCGVWIKSGNSGSASNLSSGRLFGASSALSLNSASNLSSHSHGHSESLKHKVVLTQYSTSWFEVLNESGQSVPYWTRVKDLVRQQPKAFLLRRELRCFFHRSQEKNDVNQQEDDLSSDNMGLLQAGTVLNFLESGKYKVQGKGRQKSLQLVKCSDQRAGRLVYLSMEDKCALSPVAGPGNISGAHTLPHLINQFHLPLRVRPVFGASPVSDPNRGQTHHLRLTELHRGDLIFMAPLSNPERFYVVTPRMLDDHVFYLGESQLHHHKRSLAQHSQKAMSFLQAYHEMEKLRYLLRHLQAENPHLTTGVLSGPNSHRTRKSHAGSAAPSTINGSTSSGAPRPGSLDPEEQNKLLDEVEDIYYYVRNGHMPSRLQVRDRTTSLELSKTPFKTFKQPQTLVEQVVQPPRSASCNNILSSRDQQSENAPPLPPRLYDSPTSSNGSGHSKSKTSATGAQTPISDAIRKERSTTAPVQLTGNRKGTQL